MSGAAVRSTLDQAAAAGGGSSSSSSSSSYPNPQRQQDFHFQSSLNNHHYPASQQLPVQDGTINSQAALASFFQQQPQPPSMQAPPSMSSQPLPMESNQVSSSMPSNANSGNSNPHSDGSNRGLGGMNLEPVPAHQPIPDQHSAPYYPFMSHPNDASAPLSMPSPFTQTANDSMPSFPTLLGSGSQSQDVPTGSSEDPSGFDLVLADGGPHFGREQQQQQHQQQQRPQQNGNQQYVDQHYHQRLPNGPSSAPLMHSQPQEQAQSFAPHRHTVSGAHAPFGGGNLAPSYLYTNGPNGIPPSTTSGVPYWQQAPLSAPSSTPHPAGSLSVPGQQFSMTSYPPGPHSLPTSSSSMGPSMPPQHVHELYTQQQHQQHFYQQVQMQQAFQHQDSFTGTLAPSRLTADVPGATMGQQQSFDPSQPWRPDAHDASIGGVPSQSPATTAHSGSSRSPVAARGRSGPASSRRRAANRSVLHANAPGTPTPKKKRCRRPYNAVERWYKCDHIDPVLGPCTKGYGTLNHLNFHITDKKHGEKKTSEDFKEVTEIRKAENRRSNELRRLADAQSQRGAVAGLSGPQQQPQHQIHGHHHQQQQQQMPLNYTRPASQSQAQHNPGQRASLFPGYMNGIGSDQDADGSTYHSNSGEWMTDSNRQSDERSPVQAIMPTGMVGGSVAPVTQQHLAATSSSSSSTFHDIPSWSSGVAAQGSSSARTFDYNSDSSPDQTERSGESSSVSTRQTRSSATEQSTRSSQDKERASPATRGRRRHGA